jgi:uncharacterized protein YecT (DUF1311 family)
MSLVFISAKLMTFGALLIVAILWPTSWLVEGGTRLTPGIELGLQATAKQLPNKTAKSDKSGKVRLPAKREHSIDQALDICWEKALTTADQVACATKAQMLWDQELNKTYQALLSALNVPSQTALRSAQREWLRYRDAEYKALDEFYGQLSGSMYIPILTVKKAEVIKQRALLLQQYLTLVDESR